MSDGIEGRDYFYDRAKGEYVSCSHKCNIPTSYPLLCGEKCYGYIPKPRSTTTATAAVGLLETSIPEWQWIVAIVVVVCLILLAVFLMYLCRRKLRALSSRLREMFCERLVIAVPETRNPAVSYEMSIVNDPLLNGQGGTPV